MFDHVEEIASLPPERLEEELAAQAAHVEAGLCRLLELAAECERRLGWAGAGTTFAAWLAWRCSLSARQAREYERVATGLAELPQIHEAFSRGELSFAKTSALMRIAEPENEARLLELAEVMTRPRLLLPRLRANPVRRRPPHPPLERGWTDRPRQSCLALPPPPPAGARARLLSPARRERRGPVHEPARNRNPKRAAVAAVDARDAPRPEQPPRSRHHESHSPHRLRDRLDLSLAVDAIASSV